MKLDWGGPLPPQPIPLTLKLKIMKKQSLQLKDFGNKALPAAKMEAIKGGMFATIVIIG